MKRLASLLVFFLLLVPSFVLAQDGNVNGDVNGDSLLGGTVETGQDFLSGFFEGFLVYIVSKVAWVFSSLVDIVNGFLEPVVPGMNVFRATLLVLVPIMAIGIWKLEWILSIGANTIRWILLFLMIIFFIVGFFGV